MTNDATQAREDRILDELCEQLSHREGVDVRVIRRPDRDERREQAVDAIIQRGSKQWAVEHTRVFNRPNMLGLHKRLASLKSIISEAITAAFPAEAIGVAVPVEELPPGSAGERAARLIAKGAIETLPSVPKGKAMLFRVNGFKRCPAVIHHLGRRGYCIVLPRTPDNDGALRVADIQRALVDKGPKVHAVRHKGFSTILVLDSAEVLTHGELSMAFEGAATADLVEPFDEIYLALSTWEPAAFELFKSGNRWPLDQPEHAEFVELWSWAQAKWEREGRGGR